MNKSNRTSNIFGAICIAAIFAGCVEGPDGEITLWTYACFAVAVVTGWLSKKNGGEKWQKIS